MSNVYEVTVEITKNSSIKYEINKETGALHVDRILFGTNVYPHNYGFIPKTLDLDGDPLDVVIISHLALQPLCKVKCRIIGSLNMIDGGERDTKLLAVIESDHRYNEYQNLSDIPKGVLSEIQDFFLNYKNLENKKVEILNVWDLAQTEIIIKEGFALFDNKK